jgi:hypothetical protein
VVPYDHDVAAERAPRAGDGGAGASATGSAVADIRATVDSPAEQRAALERMREQVERRLAELGGQ